MKRLPNPLNSFSMSVFVAIITFILSDAGGCAWVQDHIFTSKVIYAQVIPSFNLPQQNPEAPYLQFIAVGDAGTGGAGQRDVGEAMAEKASRDSVAFVLLLGDNFYEDGVRSVSDEQWETKFEDMYWQSSLQIPFYAVLGNHDHRLNPQAQVEYTAASARWRMPDRYYTFSHTIDDTTQVQFFCLDTYPLSDVSRERLQSLPTTSTVTRQLHWLGRELSATHARWKIVAGHHPVYSGGVHGDNEGLAALLEPIFLKHGVDLYLCGHDHDQQLLKPIKGVHYIVSGAGGKHRDVTWRENTIYAGTNLGFAFFRVSSNDLLVEFINRNGDLEYAHVFTKND